MRERFTLIRTCLLTLLLAGCASSMSVFDQYAYTQVTSVKVDALNVIDLGTEDYAKHKQEADAVQTQMQKAYEYEKNRPKNPITAEMWRNMLDTNGKLYGGFVRFWRKQNAAGKSLNSAFIEDERKQIGEAFDQIAQLESNKIKK